MGSRDESVLPVSWREGQRLRLTAPVRVSSWIAFFPRSFCSPPDFRLPSGSVVAAFHQPTSLATVGGKFLSLLGLAVQTPQSCSHSPGPGRVLPVSRPPAQPRAPV